MIDALLFAAGGLIGLVVLTLAMMSGPQRGYRPQEPITGPPPCAILAMESPLRDSGVCAGEPPVSARFGKGVR